MEILDVLRLNLLSPMVLAFVLGIIATVVKSDLEIPEQAYGLIAVYLLFAIGLKGGFDLARSPTGSFWGAAAMAALIGALIPLWSYVILQFGTSMSKADAIALGIHMGTVSAVTLSAGITFLNEAQVSFEGFMPTMYVIMEIPAVITGLVLANWYLGDTKQSIKGVFTSALTGKSFLLLGGGVMIGFISGDQGYQQVAPFFVDLFSGFLALFLLQMGTKVGRRLQDLRKMGLFLIVFSIIMPTIHGFIGAWLGSLVGLSVGGAMILGTIAASASFITAPALVENNIPQANPGYYLTASLVITFPFNLTLGLPIYFEFAKWFAG